MIHNYFWKLKNWKFYYLLINHEEKKKYEKYEKMIVCIHRYTKTAKY